MSVIVILLAAQRAGVVNPLAERAGVSHKCLVPIRERPLIDRMLDTLTALPDIAEIRVVLEPEAHGAVAELQEQYSARGVPVRTIASDANLVESVLHAVGSDEGPFIVTTADNVLLTSAGFEEIRAALDEADAVVGVTTRERVHAAHPEGQRNFYEFKEAGYANCNIYGIVNREALRSAEIFREGGQFQANPMRMIRAFGLLNILMMRFRMIGLRTGLERVGKRMGLRVRPVVFADGSLAIDVDNERTYACVEAILEQRGDN